ncbi:VF530 family DNA-binding protein [Shewanella maritima]|uniref:VF530 family protein n=1 Tax=Shewanella maritima TaxID=2520507 RepID=UPI0037362F34
MTQKNNPLHGIKLEKIVNDLVDEFGWETLSTHININCFKSNPSVKSSLKFLRRTPWAREKVEYLWLKTNDLPLPTPKPFESKPAQTTSQTSTKHSISSSNSSQSDKPVNAHIWGK